LAKVSSLFSLRISSALFSPEIKPVHGTVASFCKQIGYKIVSFDQKDQILRRLHSTCPSVYPEKGESPNHKLRYDRQPFMMTYLRSRFI
jgi:hypothetical protein